jgi:hypothetical protein
MDTTRDVIATFANSCYQLCLADAIWRSFGFRRRPRWSGSLFRPFRSAAKNIIEPALYRELLCLGIANCSFALRATVPSSDGRAILSKVIEICLRGPGGNEQPWEAAIRYHSLKDFEHGVAANAARYASTSGRPKELATILMNNLPSQDKQVFSMWIMGATALATDHALVAVRAALVQALEGAPNGNLGWTDLAAPDYLAAATAVLGASNS